MRLLHGMRLASAPTARIAQILLLAPRPARFADDKQWDLLACAVAEAWHFVFSLRRRQPLRRATVYDDTKVRLAELARRHARVASAVQYIFVWA